ncbi:MAG: o-succinylbenzoate synthase [Dehalococcoidia bacterium]|nr:o-succinylbenzoate synthase [Dehalococcoidia bacterium]
MKIRALRWTAYRLPYREAFATASATAATSSCREGLLLRLTTDADVAGAIGLGDAAPLPERGGDIGEVLTALARLAPRLIGAAEGDALNQLSALPGPSAAALACALDTALLDVAARARNTTVASLLAAPQVLGGRASVAVNATIGAPSLEAAVRHAEAARAVGFPCVKLKLGMAATVAEERERVAAVRAALGPDVRLRVDANGAWDAERAIAVLRALADLDIEYVEQPTPPGDFAALAEVAAVSPIPVAVDEDVLDLDSARRLLATGAGILIVKPMTVGGLRPARRIVEMALAAGAQAVVTTTIDSGVGVAAALHLAASLTQPDESTAHGLATGPLLEHDLLARSIPIVAGRMALPDGPGLGVAIDELALARYATAEGAAP